MLKNDRGGCVKLTPPPGLIGLNYFQQQFSIFEIWNPSLWPYEFSYHNKLSQLGSAVLTFIGYIHPDRQTNTEREKPNIYKIVLNDLI